VRQSWILVLRPGCWTDYLKDQSVEDLELLIALTRDPERLSAPMFYRAYYLCRVLFRRMEHGYYQYVVAEAR